MLKFALTLALLVCVGTAIVRLPLMRKMRPLNRLPGETVYLRNPRQASHLRNMHGEPALSRSRSGQKGYPLRGNWTQLALWYMTIDVGATNQTFHVQVDTGSSDVGIPDAQCSCGHHLDAPWNPKSDSSAFPARCSGNALECSGNGAFWYDDGGMSCGYTISYEDGSGYTAELYNDTVVFGSTVHGGIQLQSQFIGSIVSEVTPNGPFEPTAVDGIAGFAQQFLSVVNAPTLLDTLTKQISGCPFVFSMCGDVNHQGGVLTVCGAGNHHSGSIAYTPMVNYDQGFYNIYAVDMAVNGKRLNVHSSVYNNGGCTVDSGTTMMLLPDKAYDAMKQVFLANCSQSNLHGVCDVSSSNTLFDGGCFHMTAQQLAAFPTLTLIAGQSNPITISFPQNAYLVPGFCSDTTQYSFSITNIGGTGTLLGDPIMISNEVVYDVAQRRMGFAPKANCAWSK